ncbi:exodeoxyribonuclease III [Teredinibacter sp. KSP-S5-2]|uniref:exodeoxyribonuclease III n=1 Tax=Teredinibacter sp. KSP-S5-2 TaxID=3034506 RepID=UPI00293495E4|nr:exodeoxyribonuclease III [Teredinibacter sp. KSP-S5-2]WNO11400.1 exodeoxyribonuclease III [Teredinibacter sp. KSP-S5-2]
MKCISFNVNSLRSRLHQLKSVVDKHQPDFIGLQETKVTDEDFPIEAVQELGYHVEFMGQKTHYGVALLSKTPFEKVVKGFDGDTDETQKRFIGGLFTLSDNSKIWVFNGYFPQGESRDHPTKFPNKEKYYQDLNIHLNTYCNSDEQVIVMGDMNISHTDLDIGIGEDNRKRWLKSGKCSFLPEEREWLDTLLSWGLKDTYRELHPESNDQFSWFDYRSRGFEREPKRGLRIDLILATESLSAKCTEAGIDYEIRGMEKPSDHCPIWSTFSI